jgi:hypothetical protein
VLVYAEAEARSKQRRMGEPKRQEDSRSPLLAGIRCLRGKKLRIVDVVVEAAPRAGRKHSMRPRAAAPLVQLHAARAPAANAPTGQVAATRPRRASRPARRTDPRIQPRRMKNRISAPHRSSGGARQPRWYFCQRAWSLAASRLLPGSPARIVRFRRSPSLTLSGDRLPIWGFCEAGPPRSMDVLERILRLRDQLQRSEMEGAECRRPRRASRLTNRGGSRPPNRILPYTRP